MGPWESDHIHVHITLHTQPQHYNITSSSALYPAPRPVNMHPNARRWLRKWLKGTKERVRPEVNGGWMSNVVASKHSLLPLVGGILQRIFTCAGGFEAATFEVDHRLVNLSGRRFSVFVHVAIDRASVESHRR